MTYINRSAGLWPIFLFLKWISQYRCLGAWSTVLLKYYFASLKKKTHDKSATCSDLWHVFIQQLLLFKIEKRFLTHLKNWWLPEQGKDLKWDWVETGTTSNGTFSANCFITSTVFYIDCFLHRLFLHRLFFTSTVFYINCFFASTVFLHRLFY